MTEVKPQITITKKLPLRMQDNNLQKPKLIPLADRIRALREELILKDIKNDWEEKRKDAEPEIPSRNLNDNLQR